MKDLFSFNTELVLDGPVTVNAGLQNFNRLDEEENEMYMETFALLQIFLRPQKE
jgi:hypothetical protein